jgi:phage-related holin
MNVLCTFYFHILAKYKPPHEADAPKPLDIRKSIEAILNRKTFKGKLKSNDQITGIDKTAAVRVGSRSIEFWPSNKSPRTSNSSRKEILPAAKSLPILTQETTPSSLGESNTALEDFRPLSSRGNSFITGDVNETTSENLRFLTKHHGRFTALFQRTQKYFVTKMDKKAALTVYHFDKTKYLQEQYHIYAFMERKAVVKVSACSASIFSCLYIGFNFPSLHIFSQGDVSSCIPTEDVVQIPALFNVCFLGIIAILSGIVINVMKNLGSTVLLENGILMGTFTSFIFSYIVYVIISITLLRTGLEQHSQYGITLECVSLLPWCAYSILLVVAHLFHPIYQHYLWTREKRHLDFSERSFLYVLSDSAMLNDFKKIVRKAFCEEYIMFYEEYNALLSLEYGKQRNKASTSPTSKTPQTTLSPLSNAKPVENQSFNDCRNDSSSIFLARQASVHDLSLNLYEQFLLPSSRYMLALPAEVLEPVKMEVRRGHLHPHIFLPVYNHVCLTLYDTCFSMFLNSRNKSSNVSI